MDIAGGSTARSAPTLTTRQRVAFGVAVLLLLSSCASRKINQTTDIKPVLPHPYVVLLDGFTLGMKRADVEALMTERKLKWNGEFDHRTHPASEPSVLYSYIIEDYSSLGMDGYLRLHMHENELTAAEFFPLNAVDYLHSLSGEKDGTDKSAAKSQGMVWMAKTPRGVISVNWGWAWKTERDFFVDQLPLPVQITPIIDSELSVADALERLDQSHIIWRREPRTESPPRRFDARLNIDTIALPGFRHLGQAGEAKLLFSNDRLMALTFRPRDKRSYTEAIDRLPDPKTMPRTKGNSLNWIVDSMSDFSSTSSWIKKNDSPHPLFVWGDRALIWETYGSAGDFLGAGP